MLCLWGVFHKKVRTSFFSLLKALFVPKLIIPIVVMIIYITFIVSYLSKVGFWEPHLLKDTLVWFFGFAVISYFNINKVNEEDRYIRKIIIDHVKLFVIIQFVVNTYVFHWAIELLLVPFTALLTGMLAISQHKTEYRDLEKFLQGALSLVGTTFIIFSFTKAITDSDNFFTSMTFHKFFLPLFLLIFLIPFIYLLALAILYETTFIRLKIKEYYKKNLNYIRFKVITTCHFKMSRLKRFQKIMFEFDLSNKDGVSLAMDKIRNKT